MHAGVYEIVGKPAEHIGLDATRGVNGRDEIGKDAVEVGTRPGLGSALLSNIIKQRPAACLRMDRSNFHNPQPR